MVTNMFFTPKFYLDEKQKRKYEALVPHYTKPLLDKMIEEGIGNTLNNLLGTISPARRGIPPPPAPPTPPAERLIRGDGSKASTPPPSAQLEYR